MVLIMDESTQESKVLEEFKDIMNAFMYMLPVMQAYYQTIEDYSKQGQELIKQMINELDKYVTG